MKAAVYKQFGGADVVKIEDVERPDFKANEVLVRVYATAVSAADYRFRAADFPASFWLIGRLMVGLARPRNPILGTDFAGRVVAVGDSVTKFKLGDHVFGFKGSGSHAEYLNIAEDAAMAHMSEHMPYEDFAALPFGAMSGLAFMRNFGKVRPGQKALIYGAAGGVGSYALQFAKYYGAEVTAVSSGANAELLKSLGADHVIDRHAEDFTKSDAKYDLVFDTTGKTRFSGVKRVLAATGLYIPLQFGWTEIFQSLITRRGKGKRIVVGVNGGTQANMQFLADLVSNGEIKPVIDSVYRFDDIVAAHQKVEDGHKRGAVVVRVAAPEALTNAA